MDRELGGLYSSSASSWKALGKLAIEISGLHEISIGGENRELWFEAVRILPLCQLPVFRRVRCREI